ncbi:SNF2 family N-terminal domain-containing protein [Dipodascopsis uninucleata]
MAPSRITRSAAAGTAQSPVSSSAKPDRGNTEHAAQHEGGNDGSTGRLKRSLRSTPARTSSLKKLEDSANANTNPRSVHGMVSVGLPNISDTADELSLDTPTPSAKRQRTLRRRLSSINNKQNNGAGKSNRESEGIATGTQSSKRKYLHTEEIGETNEPCEPRIKIKYSVPKPIVSHPGHIPPPATHGSLGEYLSSFRSLETDDVSEDVFNSRILEEARLRKQIEDARVGGKLIDADVNSPFKQGSLKRPFDPPHHHSHHDYLLSQALHLSKLASDERRNHISRAKKVASMVQVHFKRLSGADEKERKLEEKRIRQLAKRTAMEVKRKWRLAEKVVRQRITERRQELQRQAGKEQLNSILDHSTQLLEARRDQLNMRDSEDLEAEENADAIDSSDSENMMDSDLDMSSEDDSEEGILDSEDRDASAMPDATPDTESEAFEQKPFEYKSEQGEKTEIDVDATDDAIAIGAATSEQMMKLKAKTDAEEQGNSSVSRSQSVISRGESEPLNVVPRTPIPFLLRGKLREYQHLGLDWLAGLYNSNTNGILADEMGLGKTIQTISLLSYLACEKGVWGPHLIVVPTSVMLNWEMEFKRFAPGFRILTYYGNPAQRKEKRRGWNNDDSWDVCITSYQLVIHDQNAFRRKQWHYLILDEAHNIKNFRSQRWQALLNFKAYRRLLLTGTPLQNNLIELWSLLYFLMPSTGSASGPNGGGFANLADFQEWFSHPVDKMIEGNFSRDDAEARGTISRLHQVLRPYLLRRLKADVEKQMPAKYEHIVYCKLSKRQRFLYDDFMSRAQTKETLESGNFLSIINCLMQLRKVCNHPDLFEVRPIVTSFAMQRSAVAEFEIKELLVRRKLLESDSQSKLDFDFLNLKLMQNEYMTTYESKSIFNGSATDLIKTDVSSLESSLVPNFKVSYSSLDSFRNSRLHLKKIENLDRLRSVLYINKYRCARRPVYGKNILDFCNIVSPGVKRNTWIQNYPCDKMVKTVIERSDIMRDAIEHYAFVTPAAVAIDLPKYVFSGIPKSEFSKLRLTTVNPMHQAQVKLSIAFPDKRLLQYDCGKLQKLAELLLELKAGGHRALIFTQMTKVLDILEQFLNIHGYRYMRLDGATKIEQRQLLTERFNTDPKIFVFILSTRSGGLGINLTGADTVIFYDSDWNPAMDKQCQDRCHRIGQNRDVHIYRFVSEHTIESNILRKAYQKRMLDDIVIQEGDFTTDYFTKLSLSDMLGTECDEKTNSALENQVQGLKGGLERALAQAEDEDDVAAANVAMKEAHVDNNDFYETSNKIEASTPDRTFISVASSEVNSASGKGQGLSVIGDGEEAIEDEYIEEDVPSVDDYMIRFIEGGYYWD